MRVWMVTIGEPLPTDEGDSRLLRTAIICNLLSEKGHEVTFWNSTFDHNRKQHRFKKSTTVNVNTNYRIRLFHSGGYKKNVSLARFISHHQMTREFARLIEAEKRPDIIVCSLPLVELCQVAIRYGRKNGIPVVLDLRDMWPDIFVDAIPKTLRPLGKLAMQPLIRKKREVCKQASALFGITPEFVKWGQQSANRSPNVWDNHFWLGYSKNPPQETAVNAARERWLEDGLDPQAFIVCFFGVFTEKLDLETVFRAAHQLKRSGRKFRFVLCGRGESLEALQKRCETLDNVWFPGWRGASDIWSLMTMSKAGLAPYRSRRDFQASIPTKAIEYMAAGLPVVSSLKGSLERLLREKGCGFTYPNGDSDALVKYLIELYDNGDSRQHQATIARQLFEKEFVAEQVYGRMIDEMENICSTYKKQKIRRCEPEGRSNLIV